MKFLKSGKRILRVEGKIYICPRGVWVDIPVSIKYKLQRDRDFRINETQISLALNTPEYVTRKNHNEVKKTVKRVSKIFSSPVDGHPVKKLYVKNNKLNVNYDDGG